MIDSNHFPEGKCSEPALHHWSDFAYIAWEDTSYTVGPFRAPRFVIQEGIQNEETERVLDLVMRWAGHPLKADYRCAEDIEWPGVELTREMATVPEDDVKKKQMGQQAFAAVIGSIHGAGVANLLIDRKEEFGVQTIKKVNVILRGHYNLIFHIGPA